MTDTTRYNPHCQQTNGTVRRFVDLSQTDFLSRTKRVHGCRHAREHTRARNSQKVTEHRCPARGHHFVNIKINISMDTERLSECIRNKQLHKTSFGCASATRHIHIVHRTPPDSPSQSPEPDSSFQCVQQEGRRLFRRKSGSGLASEDRRVILSGRLQL